MIYAHEIIIEIVEGVRTRLVRTNLYSKIGKKNSSAH